MLTLVSGLTANTPAIVSTSPRFKRLAIAAVQPSVTSDVVAALGLSVEPELINPWLAPLTNGWLKLPRETANVFIMGLIRRDFGAAGLSNMVLSPEQLLVSLVTITLFVPCIASVIVLFKERSKTEGLLVWFGSWVAAFLIGGLVAQIII